MGRPKKSQQRREANEYYRQRRVNGGAEMRQASTDRHRVMYHKRKAAAKELAEEERRAKQRDRTRRHRAKKRKNIQPALPSTPRSKAKLITTMIETATPTTSGLLQRSCIKKSSERAAETAIAEATSQVIKKKTVKRALLPKLKDCNKSAVSKRLGMPRGAFYYTSQKGKNPKTTAATIQQIIDYYNREDIITIYPNKTKNGQVIKTLKHTKKKTYTMFVQEFGRLTGETNFAKLRPRSIKLRKQSKYLQCICDPCDNVQMLSRAIRLSMVKADIDPPTFLNDDMLLAKASVCDFNNYACLDNHCRNCNPEEVFRQALDAWLKSEDGNVLHYEMWMNVKEQYKGKEISKLQKARRSGLRSDLYQDLVSQLKKTPSFALHKMNAVAQLHSYKLCKETLLENEAMAIVDFAENYVCRQHSEAQSAYYSRNSTTVHPMVVVFAPGGPVSRDYFDIITNDLKHDGSAVKVFVTKLSNYITTTYPQINTLKFWSDGCGVQYKSKLPMLNISQNFHIPQKVIWNFFGSRHGKNESDGESAVIKSKLDIDTRSQQLTLLNAMDCFNHLQLSALCIPQNQTARRHFEFVDREEIEVERNSLPDPICAISKVRQIHSISGISGKVTFTRLSCYCRPVDACRHGDMIKSTFNYPEDPNIIDLLNANLGEEDMRDKNHYIDLDHEEPNSADQTGSQPSLLQASPSLVDNSQENLEPPMLRPNSTIVDSEPEENEIMMMVRANPDIFATESDDEEEDRFLEVDWSEFDEEWEPAPTHSQSRASTVSVAPAVLAMREQLKRLHKKK